MRDWLRDLRNEKNMTQQEIADDIGITRQYYSAIEKGDRQSKMSIDIAQKLAVAFSVSLDYILENENKTA